MPYLLFLKSSKIWNCCLLQNVGGALRVSLESIFPKNTPTLTLCLLVEASADNLCKQFGPWSGLKKNRAWTGSKLFDSNGIPKIFFRKRWFWKKIRRRQNVWKIIQYGKSQKCTNCKAKLCNCEILKTCDFVCGSMSHAKSSLHQSVILLSDILGVVCKHLLFNCRILTNLYRGRFQIKWQLSQRSRSNIVTQTPLTILYLARGF